MAQVTDFKNWYAAAREAVRVFDAGQSWKNLQTWQSFVGKGYNESNEDPQLERLRKDLLFSAFAFLSQESAIGVLKTLLSEFAQSEANITEKIQDRLKVVGYVECNREREAMKKAFFESTASIGGIKIGQWLTQFEKLIPGSQSGVATKFIIGNSQAAGLSKMEQLLLRRILSVYEDWIYEETLSVFDAAILLKTQQGGMSVPSNVRVLPKNSPGQSPIINLPLLQALSKYEQLGNQLITAERIRVKSQLEPVRPSLLYWLKYYRDELGIGHHDSVQRGQFLFRSENGKHLSDEERERVNLILRSVEENYPLQIDTANGEIIFPRFENNSPVRPVYQEPIVAPKPTTFVTPPAAPLPTPPVPPVPPREAREAREERIERKEERKEMPTAPRPSFQVGRGMNFNNVQPTPLPEKGTLSFTSSHVFPAEKEREVVTQVQAPAPVSNPAPRAPQRQSSPFHIYPMSLGEEAGEEENR